MRPRQLHRTLKLAEAHKLGPRYANGGWHVNVHRRRERLRDSPHEQPNGLPFSMTLHDAGDHRIHGVTSVCGVFGEECRLRVLGVVHKLGIGTQLIKAKQLAGGV